MSDFEIMAAARQSLHNQVFSHPNVVGIGQGKKWIDGKLTGTQSIIVYVQEKLSLAQIQIRAQTENMIMIPASVDGIPTDVIQAGLQERLIVRPTQTWPPTPPHGGGFGHTLQDRTQRVRPMIGGISIGGVHVTAGTLGMVVIDNKTGKLAILSNNHVLADVNKNPVGSNVYQPGMYDGATPNDFCGALLRFIPIQFGDPRANYEDKKNIHDAALADPTNPDSLSLGIWDIEGTIPNVPYDANSDWIRAAGKAVQCSSRTSLYRQGTILSVNTSIKVSYGDTPNPAEHIIALFINQIVFKMGVAGGDSGSIVTLLGTPAYPDSRPVALLFAGNFSNMTAIGNPFPSLLESLDISLPGAPPPPSSVDIVRATLIIRTLGGSSEHAQIELVKNPQDKTWHTPTPIPIFNGIDYQLEATA